MNVRAIIAKTFGIDEDQVDDDLSYGSISQWDSLQHVSLMVALELELGIEIDRDLRLRLMSVKAIDEYFRSRAANATPAAAGSTRDREAPTIHRGLHGVRIDRSQITRIDGEGGNLEYRGYSIHDLAAHATFEDTAHLLIRGELPDAASRAAFASALREARQLPREVAELMRTLEGARPMDALRTGVSALGAFDPDSGDDSVAASERKGLRLIAQVPLLIATHHAARHGHECVTPEDGIAHAPWFLHLLLGTPPTAATAKLMDRDLVVHADHSSNASTFTARVVVGCRSNMHAAITAALASFEGQLHGGAAELVMSVVDEVGSPERAAAYVADKFRRCEPVMGFGHRVYRTEDPRVRHLRDAALQVARARGSLREFEIITALVEAMKPYARHGVEPNVDLYAGLFYRMLGLPDDLAVPIFVAGRIAGWVAQALEQQNNNVLIRPLLEYTGPTGRAYPLPEAVRNAG